MLRTISSTVARSAPRRVAGASRGFAAHAGQAEQLVLEGKPTKEWLDFKKNVEHHAAGSLSSCIPFAAPYGFICPFASETTELWRKIRYVRLSSASPHPGSPITQFLRRGSS